MGKMSVVFDFDGVIGDSLPVLVNIANSQFGKYLHEPLSVDLIRVKGVRKFFQEYRMSGFRLVLWIWKARRMLANEHVKMISGMGRLLQQLSERGLDLQLVSSGGKGYIARTLEREGLSHLFSSIHTNIGLFKKAKHLKRLSGNKKDYVYVGDEVRDIEAAHKAGVTCISTSWGYESKTILKEAKPDYLVDTPEELLKTIERLMV